MFFFRIEAKYCPMSKLKKKEITILMVNFDIFW